MDRLKLVMIAFIAFGHMAIRAEAQPQVAVLHSQLAWTVERTYYPDQRLQVCSAFSHNRTQQTEDYIGFNVRDDGLVSVNVITSRRLWSNDFAGTLVLSINQTEDINLNGAAYRSGGGIQSVEFTFAPQEDKSGVWRLLATGRTISMKDPSSKRNLITWSLSGSTAALNVHKACTAKIIRYRNLGY